MTDTRKTPITRSIRCVPQKRRRETSCPLRYERRFPSRRNFGNRKNRRKNFQARENRHTLPRRSGACRCKHYCGGRRGRDSYSGHFSGIRRKMRKLQSRHRDTRFATQKGYDILPEDSIKNLPTRRGALRKSQTSACPKTRPTSAKPLSCTKAVCTATA